MCDREPYAHPNSSPAVLKFQTLTHLYSVQVNVSVTFTVSNTIMQNSNWYAKFVPSVRESRITKNNNTQAYQVGTKLLSCVKREVGLAWAFIPYRILPPSLLSLSVSVDVIKAP